MTMREVIAAIYQKHKDYGITLNPPATELEIRDFEKKLGFSLPADFKEFYSICNGLECTEDIFKMVSLQDALLHDQDYGKNWFHFADYMIYCDMWSLRRRDDGGYEIINRGETELVLTSSLLEFLERFLQGNVFEKGGLYEWHDELKFT